MVRVCGMVCGGKGGGTGGEQGVKERHFVVEWVRAAAYDSSCVS
jgi:hypothetical protein